MSERAKTRKFSQVLSYRRIFREVMQEACDRGKLLSKAAARREAEYRIRKPRVDHRLDTAQLAALREQGFI